MLQLTTLLIFPTQEYKKIAIEKTSKQKKRESYQISCVYGLLFYNKMFTSKVFLFFFFS